MEIMLHCFLFVLLQAILIPLAVYADGSGETLLVDIEASSTPVGYDLGSKLVIIVVFLAILFFLSRFIIARAKSQKIALPKFLSKYPIFKDISPEEEKPLYEMKIIHREQFSEGTELMVLDINDRHILLSKNIHGGIVYITDLESAKDKYKEDVTV